MSQRSDTYQFDTLAVRSGQTRGHEGEHNDPIFMTSSFVFDSAEMAAARFAGTEPGNVYSRFTNPTVRTFEERLAALEGAKYCSATASGMAAVLAACLVTLKAGDHIVASRSLFGATINLFNKTLTRFGVTVSYVALDSLEDWEAAITPATKMLFAESPSNPLGEVVDLRALSSIAKRNHCWLVIDNVACTPALQQPIALGADVVIHSATKYIDGQGRAVGGALVTSNDDLGKEFFAFNRSAGPCMSPFNAWIFLKGLETLSVRMQAHSERAAQLARWLDAHESVARVYYAGLESHPGHAIASAQQSAFGGVLAFDVVGGKEQAWTVVDSTQLLSITANLGDAKTTITHPASTTHARITEEERLRMGLGDSLIRVAVGLEALDDIKADLQRGLSKISPSAASANEANRYAGDISPTEAWEHLCTEDDAVLIDVRTDAEWSYVGLPDVSSLNKEVLKLSWKTFPGMGLNPEFVPTLQSMEFHQDQAMLFLCRSGVRSKAAAIAMTTAGYRRCFNVAEGFEGDRDDEKRRGARGGWKASGLPWVQE